MGLLRLSASDLPTQTGQQSSCHRAMPGLGEVFVTSGGTHGGRLCPDCHLWNVISAWSGLYTDGTYSPGELAFSFTLHRHCSRICLPQVFVSSALPP